MPQFRVDFFFLSDSNPWSERYYCVGVNNHKDALTRGEDLGRFRTRMLAGPRNDVVLDVIRISDDQLDGDSLVSTKYSIPPESGYNNNLVTPREVPWSVLLLRAESGVLYRKSIYLGGVPQVEVPDPYPGNLLLDAAFLRAYAAFKQELTRPNKWGFKCIREPGDGLAAKPVRGAAIVGGKLVLEVDTAGLAQGQLLNVRRFRRSGGTVGINGQKQIAKVVDATHLILANTAANATFTRLGEIYPYLQIVKPITSLQVVGPTHHKRGVKGDYAPRGRRRPKFVFAG